MPDNPFAHSGLAQLLANWKDASDEDRRQAVEYARRACELTQWRDWQQLRYLAMTSAAVGDLPAAVTWCEKAIESAPVTERKRLENQLAAYRKRAGAERRASP
jgi:Cdc6-like AAA superfamily ATPase